MEHQATTGMEPSRVLDTDNKVLWGHHEGTPVAVASNIIRSANVSEILAHTILSRGNLVEKERKSDPKGHLMAIDLRRAKLTSADPDSKRARSSTDPPEPASAAEDVPPERTTGTPVADVFDSEENPLVRLVESTNEPKSTRGS